MQFGSEYAGKLVMRLCGQDCLEKHGTEFKGWRGTLEPARPLL
jgi:hypothetical protein